GAERRYGVEHAYEIGIDVGFGGVVLIARSMLIPKPGRYQFAGVEREIPIRPSRLARFRRAKLIHLLHGVRSQLARALDVERERLAVGHTPWNAAFRNHRRETTHRISTAAEAEQENPVSVAIQSDQRGVAIDNICRDSKPGRLASNVVYPATRLPEHEPTIGGVAESPQVKKSCLLRVNRR